MRRNLATGQKQIVSPQQQEAFNYSGSLFGTSLADLFGPYCDITTGVVRANSIVPYNWDMPVRSDSYSELTFSPRNGVDVFDFEGKYVDSFFLDVTGTLMAIHEDSLFVREKNEDELIHLVKYREK